VELAIRLDRGHGAVEGTVQDQIAGRVGFTAETDRSYLQQTLGDLEGISAAFPVRR
jgi:hypothetical protein